MEYKNLKLLSNITGHQTEPLNEHANLYYDDDDNDEDVLRIPESTENTLIHTKHEFLHYPYLDLIAIHRHSLTKK